MKSFETFKYKMLGSKFVKCLANFKMTSQFLLNFASFFMIMIDNSSVNFKLIIFILWNKESHKSPTFETFKCSGENFSYSSCHFPNHKSVILQILHHPSVP